MSERNPTIPFGNFYHPPLNLPNVMEEHGCGNSTDLSVMHGLFSLVQFNHTERVDVYDLFIGKTCIVSHEGLGKRCFLNERTVRRSIERLKEAGLIQQHKQGVCYSYHITIYDTAIEYLKRNPNHPMETTPSPVGSESKRQEIYDDANSDSLPDNSDSLSTRSDTESDIQESLQESLEKDPVSSKITGTRESEEKTGGVINNEEQKAEEKEKASLGENQEGVDFAPTKQIAEVIDSLREGESEYSATPELESFMEIYKPNDSVVWTWKDIEPAQLLHDTLTKALQANHLRIPTNAFFKHVIKEMNARIADGRLPNTPPNSFNYFIKHSHGTDLIDYTLKLLKTEVSSKRSVAQTNSYIDDLKERRTDHKETPEVQSEIDKMLGRGDLTDDQRLAWLCLGQGIAKRKRGNHVGAHELFKKAYELDPTDEHKEWLDKSIQDMYSA